jgi:uncharacterized protein YegL
MHVHILSAYQQLLKERPLFRLRKEPSIVSKGKASREQEKTQVEALRFAEPSIVEDINQFINLQRDITSKEPTRVTEDRQTEIVPVATQTPELKSPKALSATAKSTRNLRQNLIKTVTVEASKSSINLDTLVRNETMPDIFEDKMPGFTPAMVGGMPMRVDAGDKYKVERTFTPLVSRRSKVGSLKEYLLTEITTYEEKKTGERFFKISLRTGKDAAALKARPKEVVFLLDCSKSIEDERLKGFQEGIEYAIKNLNPADRFNVIAFKDGIIRFKESPVPVNKENIAQAIKFTNSFVPGKKTDTYNALYKAIDIDSPFSPSYVMILSDGRPTQGIVDSGKLIREISDENKGKISIFAYSGGSWVNRYLLDFISYKNRGWSEYSYRTHFIADNFKNMYKKIRNPVLVNIRFHVSGVKDNDVFPKMLPDFFRDAEFTLYGRYEKGEPLVLQLLGDLENETHEFIVEANLDEAKPGDNSIAYNWALNKIYYLIGLLQNDENNAQIIQRIKELSQKFSIETPYIKF